MLKGTCNLCFFKKLLCKLQIFLICKYKNNFSDEFAQSNAEGI